MNCEEAIRLVDGYLDGELDAITNQEIESHLRDCRACQQTYEAHASLIGVISNRATYYRAPVELRSRIQSALQKEIGDGSRQSPAPVTASVLRRKLPTQRDPIFRMQWSWLALAATLVVAAVMVVNSQRSRGDQFLATQLIGSHVRSLLANHLTDVASSDQHTVKPWLDTKLDFAPPVVDLSSDGFPLIGGRLDYLDNRTVAALIYQRRKHFINLFIWPAESAMTTAGKTISRQGYQLVHWVDGDFNYWAVSDVSDADLQLFKQAFEKQLPHR